MSHWLVESRPASKGAAAAALFQRAQGCNPSPPQLSRSNPLGSSGEHRWPRAMGPTLGKPQAESVSCGQGSPRVLGGRQPAQGVLLFCLKGTYVPCRAWALATSRGTHRLIFPRKSFTPYLLLTFSSLPFRSWFSGCVCLLECWLSVG